MITSRFSETDTASKAFFHNLSRFYERTGPLEAIRGKNNKAGEDVFMGTRLHINTR